MFYLHTSNKTEKLADLLSAVISREGLSSLFTPELFLIQSRGMQRMLSQFLAERFGVWCNATYLMPMQCIDFIGEKIGLDLDHQIFDRDILTWRLERILRDSDDPVMLPIAAYLSGEQAALKRYQLACQLANIFDQYQIMRPDYLQNWQKGEACSNEHGESWQRHLWLKLRAESPGVMHRGELIQSLIGALSSHETTDFKPFRRLFVFGVHTMPPLFLSAIYALSRRLDVHLFLLSPCQEYWGDIESRRRQLARRPAQNNDYTGSFPVAAFSHPLLASLGRQGADFQELMLELVDEYVIDQEAFVDPRAEQSPTVLRQLQADILEAKPEPLPESRQILAPDDSILVTACHSRIREIQVLKDHLLDWLYNDTTLELHDIVVMAPDIQHYSQLIPAVFQNVQHDISDCRARHVNAYLDGFLQFLRLFTSRYSWSDLFSLLERTEIRSHFSLTSSDIELIRHWVIASGIRWGMSAEQRRFDGLHEFSSATWRSGLERMLMGFAIDADTPVDEILPFNEIEGSHGELLGRLCQFVEIVEIARGSVRKEQTLRQWSETFRQFCSSLFDEAEQPEMHELHGLFSRLGDCLAGYHDEPVSFEVIRSWIESEADTKSSAGFLRGRLTFCSMLPMRSIPFRCICLLGMNENDYPKEDHFAPFDLLGTSYRHGDRSRRGDDRHQMLEAILAARDRLYLSYVGQSVKDNSPLCPSVVLTELFETLENYYGITDVTVNHPLHPFNAGYFTGNKEYFSYDHYQCRVAAALLEKGDTIPPVWLSAPVSPEMRMQSGCEEVAAFLSQPQSYFVRQVMGINLRNYDDSPEEHEIFEMDSLHTFVANQMIINGLLEGKEPAHLLHALQSGQGWPLGHPGEVIFENDLRDIVTFVATIRNTRVGKMQPGIPVDIEIDGVRLVGVLGNLYEGGMLFYRYGNLIGKDILRGWFYHLLSQQLLGETTTTHIIAADRTISIRAGQGGRKALSFLVQLFREGCRYPSKLHVEPAFAYARQVISNRGRGRKEPIIAARDQLEYDLKNGYLPETALLYRSQSVEQILDDEFENLCVDFMVPLWDLALSSADGGSGAWSTDL